MSEPKRRIKCRYCDYSFLPFKTNKDGKVSSGMARLRNHIEDKHPDEYDAIYKDHDWSDEHEAL